MSPAELHRRHGQKLRFLLAGGFNTLCSLGALWVLDHAIPYDPQSVLQKEAILVANWVIAVNVAFFTFKLFVYRTRGNWLREYVRIHVTYLMTLAIQSILTLTFSQLFGLSLFWANLPTMVIVTVLSYLGHTHFTFSQPMEATSATGDAGPPPGDHKPARPNAG